MQISAFKILKLLKVFLIAFKILNFLLIQSPFLLLFRPILVGQELYTNMFFVKSILAD